MAHDAALADFAQSRNVQGAVAQTAALERQTADRASVLRPLDSLEARYQAETASAAKAASASCLSRAQVATGSGPHTSMK